MKEGYRWSKNVPRPPRVLSAMVSDNELRRETEPTRNIIDGAARDDGQRSQPRQALEPLCNRGRHARLIRVLDDGRERAVEIEGQQGLRAQRGLERQLASMTEEVLHLG